MDEPERESGPAEGPLAIICGGGNLPFAVADAVARRGRAVVLFALRGFADEARVSRYRHYWMALGQYGWFCRTATKEGCRDVAFIGSVVRPALSQLRFDLGTLKILPRLVRIFRGGDNHLLSGVIAIVEQDGFRVIGAHELAPGILMPQGVLGRCAPCERDQADIARGLALIAAIGPFDVGQAAVVANNHVLAIEGIEGTDQMLARIAELRRIGRIRAPEGTGVLVKAPKPAQNRQIDLPTIGPSTIEAAAKARLAGVAVLAGETIIAEPERVNEAADRAGVFVIGVAGPAPGGQP
jgi:UDP-2,3-diacylglucosamine hydrolase